MPAAFLAGPAAVSSVSPASVGPAPSSNNAQPAPRPRKSWSNRWLAALFVLLMGGMAVAALTLALGTLKSRKTRDPKVPATIGATRALPPAELPALAYLPEDCNLVAGIHVADLLKSARGKRLLASPRLNGSDQGSNWQGLNCIEGWTGLQASAFDHVALGARIDGDVPHLVAVLRTRQPYRLEELAGRFPGKAFPHHKRPLFRIKLQPVGGGYLWCADERTLVLLLRPDAVKIEDMDRVPAFPRQADAALAPPLRKIVDEHLRQADIWLAGDVQRPETLGNLLRFVPILSKPSPPMAQARSFAVSAREDGELTILGFVSVRDEVGLRAWREFLESVALPAGATRRVIPTAERKQIDFQVRLPAVQIQDVQP
ncbi:MAG: hypothetical protein FJ271_17310 [Planctomycetes bacterium]|nr:hypothetical protein [Planctomycetota bacterium]